MPLWYVPRDGEIWIYTYAKSQKVRNLERDARATLLIETGHEYAELRGVEIEAEAEIHRDLDTVFEMAKALTSRYAGEPEVDDAATPRRSGLRLESASPSSLRPRTSPRGITASWAGPTERRLPISGRFLRTPPISRSFLAESGRIPAVTND